MNTDAQTEALSDLIGQSGAESSVPVFVSLRRSAALEFHASVQLLAERARFLTGATGVAIALDQDGQFVYCAAAGSMVPEIGATVDVTKHALGLPTMEPQTSAPGSTGGTVPPPSHQSPFAVPVLRDDKVVGFFELIPGACALEVANLETVSRLSALVSTAVAHRDAAEYTVSLIAEAGFQKPQPPTSPTLWHAPEAAASEPTPAASTQAPAPADVHTCAGCGFPVSGRRTLCLDCEKHGDDPRNDPTLAAHPPVEMFATEKEENWIGAHGYTIASLLVTALAAAIIFWLR